MRLIVTLLFASLAAAACTRAQSVDIVRAFPKLRFTNPVGIHSPGPGSNLLFVVEQRGSIKYFVNDDTSSRSTTFLDISGRITAGGEMGLLGLAFHPNYANNREFYLNYTRTITTPSGSQLQTVISRMKAMADEPLRADTLSEEILLTIPQPYQNHNGGNIMFGPDGYLYIGMGDGGGGGDPVRAGQDRRQLLAKFLRIDVDTTVGDRRYGIPPDNPYAGNSQGFQEEIFAYGVRNPWRFSFDSQTGMLWAGDVGQGAWEEVSIIEKGKNYGWNIMEGFHCYSPSSGCDTTGLTMPVWEYSHDTTGGQSITGGFVYRGTKVPALIGKYIFADFVSTKVWALDYTPGQAANATLLKRSGLSIASFGVDANKELYVCAFNGYIYRFVQNPGADVESIEQGAAAAIDAIIPNPAHSRALISYSLANAGAVHLSVFDLMGRHVATLVDGIVPAGSHSVQFDAAGFPGAVYICRIEAAGTVAARRLVLAR